MINYCLIIALSEQECEIWLKGLYYLINNTVVAPYPLILERWLRKEFYNMENTRETLVKNAIISLNYLFY